MADASASLFVRRRLVAAMVVFLFALDALFPYHSGERLQIIPYS
jgi:hypothetical protein